MSRRTGLWAAGALVLATNLFILAGAAWNRRSPPEGLIRLSERELSLRLPGGPDENSGLSLDLEAHLNHQDWISEDKLRSWGYDPESFRKQASLGHGEDRPWPKKAVFLVLELEGAAWTDWVKKEEKEVAEVRDRFRKGVDTAGDLKLAEMALAYDLHSTSRLFAVDGGLDPAALRAAHPDSTRFLIVPALVQPYLGWISEDKIKAGEKRPVIVDPRLEIDNLYVDRRWRALLLGLKGQKNRWDMIEEWKKAGKPKPEQIMPRFEVDLATGRRLEPWVQDIRLLKASPPP